MYVERPVHFSTLNTTFSVSFEIDFYHLPCAVDALGDREININEGLERIRIDESGAIQTNGYGDPLKYFETPEVDIEDSQKGEGCKIQGTLDLRKVPGNLHFSTHAHLQHLPKFFESEVPLNVSHQIHSLYFGELLDPSFRDHDRQAPITGLKVQTPESSEPYRGVFDAPSIDYYLQLVPTVYDLSYFSRVKRTYQFTASYDFLENKYEIPAVYMRYELNPITVEYSKRKESLAHFLVQLCAIIGGVFTVISLFSSIGNRWIQKFKPERLLD